ncbi:MAG: hypothetical protein O7C59_11440 [Rickettsia endosymbiont of Ixodes persulcatus]|nr:hypothetical protein [Rickettsia endosymbiont of Ixodes persulcatus]MCZ6914972.1 hypothetical protein [Rickettsia endosymbiont of Ixodes persulcatus]MCZ6919159.1 hypothetical protein [Rickettsia endosymbiont of Ixodes persulcatus]MCZ6923981.1 hypothetical protein [Rickettsia endosymbiont of Ixodes persulcatus]
MDARLRGHDIKEYENNNITEKAFEYIKQKYSSSLKTVVEHSKTTMLIFLLVIIATAYLP